MPLPPPSPSSSSLRLRRCALALAAVAATWTALIVTTGGGTVVLGGLRVSSRSAWRPAAVAIALIAVALWRTSADDRRQLRSATERAVDRGAAPLAALLAIALTAVSTILGTHVAGGADSSGYLSQSRLWAAGQVTTPAAVLVDAPWPQRGQLVSPLGYRPAIAVDRLGPTYAPGLPWLMAVGAAVLGDAGRYVWTPLAGGLLVWGTYALAAAAAPPAVALGAALLVAGSPPVLWESMQTMSDLPVAALWVWVLVWLRQPGLRATIGAGLVAAIALAVRPNLVLAAGGVWAASVAADGGPLAPRLRRAAVRALPLAVAAVAVALLNARLWGSPFISGYGPPGEVFGGANVVPNLRAVWAWIAETRGYWTAAGLVALAALALRREGARWWPAVGLTAGVLASYLSYAQFEEWWYLRFYLPLWPASAAAVSVVVWRWAGRVSPLAARLLVVGVALVTALTGIVYTEARHAFSLWRGEARYAAVGDYVRTHASDNTVVFAVQHSGALAYYGGRVVARFDEVAPDALDALCLSLASKGHAVWMVVDNWEEPEIRARFADQVRGRLDWAPVAEARVGSTRVRVYDLLAPTRATGPELIPVATHGPWPWARRASAGAK